MIVQAILNVFRDLLMGLVHLIPPVPEAFASILNMMHTGGAYMVDAVSPLGVLIPFHVVGTILLLWPALIVFWLAIGALRFVFSMLGR